MGAHKKSNGAGRKGHRFDPYNAHKKYLTLGIFSNILESSRMEQLAARKAHNLEVPGSSPGPATT